MFRRCFGCPFGCFGCRGSSSSESPPRRPRRRRSSPPSHPPSGSIRDFSTGSPNSSFSGRSSTSSIIPPGFFRTPVPSVHTASVHTPSSSIRDFSTGSPDPSFSGRSSTSSIIPTAFFRTPVPSVCTPSGSVHDFSTGSIRTSSSGHSSTISIPFAFFNLSEHTLRLASGIPLPSSHASSVRTDSLYASSGEYYDSSVRTQSGPSTAAYEATREAFENAEEAQSPIWQEYQAEHFEFSEWVADGRRVGGWISNDPTQPHCPINQSTLTFADLEKEYAVSIMRQDPLAEYFVSQFEQLGLPIGDTTSMNRNSDWRMLCIHATWLSWQGYTTQGALFLSSMYRHTGDDHEPEPQISSVSQAMYERHHNIDTLRHIFVWTVVNPDTFIFVEQFLYPRHRLYWPDNQPRVWEYNTRGYDGLLGTRIGKVISYIVLGAWPRGTRRIARIVTRSGGDGFAVYMRFDIEPVEENDVEMIG